MRHALSASEHAEICKSILLGAIKSRADKGGATAAEEISLALENLNEVVASGNYFELIRRAAILVEGGGL
jgi:hypothetical protein